MDMRKRNLLTGTLLVLPHFVGTVVFCIYPLIISVIYSTTKNINDHTFVGLQHYKELITNDAFILAIKNTLKFYIIAIPLIMILSVFLAQILFKYFAKYPIFKNIFILPLIIPTGALMLVISYLFRENGAVWNMMSGFGWEPINFFSSSMSFYMVIFLFVIKYIGYNIIILLAALNDIPKEFREEAYLCGASDISYFFRIALPYMRMPLFATLIISFVNSFKIYREAFYIGGQYPHESIYFIQHFMNNNFTNMNYQRLTSAAILLFSCLSLIIIIIYIIQKKLDYN